MVTAKYTDNTQIEQMSPLGLGRGSESLAGVAAAQANLIHNTTKFVTDKIQKQTDIAAEEAGVEEGLKGQKAKPWSNLTEAGRAYNQGIAKTAPLMISNDLTSFFSNQFRNVTSNNYHPSAYQDFKETTEAYLKKYTSETPAHLRPYIARAGLEMMGNYQTQFSKGLLKSQLINAQLETKTQINQSQNNAIINAQNGLASNNPDLYNQHINHSLGYINSRRGLTANQMFKASQNLITSSLTAQLGYKHNQLTNAWQDLKTAHNAKASGAFKTLNEIHQNPEEWVRSFVLSQAKLNPAVQTYADLTKLTSNARRIANEFKVKVSSMDSDLKANVKSLNDNMNAGITPSPNLLESTMSTLLQNGDYKAAKNLENNNKAFTLVHNALGNAQVTHELFRKATQNELGPQSKLVAKLIDDHYDKAVNNNGAYNQTNFEFNGGRQAFIDTQVQKGTNIKEARYTANAATSPDFLASIGNGSIQVNPNILQDFRHTLQHQFELNPNHNASFKAYTNQQLKGLARLLHDSNSQPRTVEIFTNLHNAGIDTEELFANLNIKGNNEQNSRTMYAAWNSLNSGSYLEKNILNQAAADKSFGLVDNKYKGHLAVNSTRVRQLLENSFPPAQAKILLNSVKQIAGAIHNGDEVGSLGAGVVHSKVNIWQDMFGSASYDSDSLYKIGLNILQVYGKHPVPGYDVIAPAEARNPLNINSKANITNMDSLQNFFTETIKNGKFYAGEHPTLAKEALADLLTGRVINPVTDASLFYRAIGGVIATAANMNPHVINDGGSGWRLVTDGGAQIYYDMDGKQGKPVKGSFYDTYALINKHKG